MDKSRGVVYVAWGQQHISEAVRSAASVRLNAGLPTCLLTDESDESLKPYFDVVKIVDFSIIHQHQYMRKWICLTESPFETTCYLDSDTVVLGSLDLGMRMAKKYRACAVIANGMTFHHGGEEYVHYNGGVVVFSRSIGYELSTAIDRAHAAVVVEGHIGDEAAIGVAFVDIGLNPFVLPQIFNMARPSRIHDRDIRVWHSRDEVLTKLRSDDSGNDIAGVKL